MKITPPHPVFVTPDRAIFEMLRVTAPAAPAVVISPADISRLARKDLQASEGAPGGGAGLLAQIRLALRGRQREGILVVATSKAEAAQVATWLLSAFPTCDLKFAEMPTRSAASLVAGLTSASRFPAELAVSTLVKAKVHEVTQEIRSPASLPSGIDVDSLVALACIATQQAASNSVMVRVGSTTYPAAINSHEDLSSWPPETRATVMNLSKKKVTLPPPPPLDSVRFLSALLSLGRIGSTALAAYEQLASAGVLPTLETSGSNLSEAQTAEVRRLAEGRDIELATVKRRWEDHPYAPFCVSSALGPTAVTRPMTQEQAAVYNLVVSRALASQAKDDEASRLSISLSLDRRDGVSPRSTVELTLLSSISRAWSRHIDKALADQLPAQSYAYDIGGQVGPTLVLCSSGPVFSCDTAGVMRHLTTTAGFSPRGAYCALSQLATTGYVTIVGRRVSPTVTGLSILDACGGAARWVRIGELVGDVARGDVGFAASHALLADLLPAPNGHLESQNRRAAESGQEAESAFGAEDEDGGSQSGDDAALESSSDPNAILCPRCGRGHMEVKGRPGKRFWRCERFPDCRESAWELNGQPRFKSGFRARD